MEDSASSSSDAVPRPSPNSDTHPKKIFYSITYALPGQITYCIPRISEDANYRQRLLRLLEAQTGISYQDVNAATGSLVVAYKSGLISSTEIREHLASLFETANLTDDTEVTSVPSTAESVILPSAPESITDTPATEPASESITDTPATEPMSESIIDSSTIEPASESITDTPATEPAIKVEYSVVHSIPGRVRFHVPQIAIDPAYVQRLQALLKSDPIVTSERINREAASVIITYKPGKVPKPKDELQSIFAIAVAYFSSLIQSAGITSNKSSSR
ncbi:MAG TPA: hypothetical protein V6D25_09625 [Leptolyngbyaceae cyanobacterium]